MVIVDHHQRPRAGDEVAACERGQAPRFDRFERLGRRIDAAEPRVRAGLAAALFPCRHGAERHQVVSRPYQPGVRIALVEPIGLFKGLFSGPGRINLLIENDARVFRDRAAHPLIAFDRRGCGAISCNRQHVQLAVRPERLFLPAAFDQRVRRQIAGVLRPWLQRSEPAFVFAAGRSDAAALVDRNRAVSEKGFHPCGVDDLQELVGHGIIVREHDIVGPFPRGARDQLAGDLERLQRFALGILHLECHAEAASDGLHALRGRHPVDFVGLSRIDERDRLRMCDRAAQQKSQTRNKT